MKKIFLLMLVFFLSCPSLLADQEFSPFPFEVLKSSFGEFWLFKPLQNKWKKLEVGDQIEEGDLVEFPIKGVLRVKHRNQFYPQKMETLVLASENRALIRVDRHIKRMTLIDGYDPIGNIELDKERKEKYRKDLTAYIREAWSRLLSDGKQSEKNRHINDRRTMVSEKPTEGRKGTDNPNRGRNFKRIIITSPQYGQNLIFPKLPQSVQINWFVEEEPVPLEYQVKLWGIGETLDQRMTYRADRDGVSVKIRKPGRYYIQVIGSGGEHQSDQHIFVVGTWDSFEKDLSTEDRLDDLNDQERRNVPQPLQVNEEN